MAVSRDFWKPHRSVSECCSEWGNVACAAFSPAEATQMSPRALSVGADVACECHKPGLCVIVVERGAQALMGRVSKMF